SLVRFHSLRPSPKPGRVGSCISLFEACSAFTQVTACMLAESPMRPSTPKASAASLPPPLLRLLSGGTNQFPGGISLPLRISAFSRRTPISAFIRPTLLCNHVWLLGVSHPPRLASRSNLNTYPADLRAI